MKYEKIKANTRILNLYKNADPWFWISGSINPYRGCEHACIYCDGRANFYRIPNYDSHIRVKINAPELLRKDLNKLGFTPINRTGKSTIEYYLKGDNSQEDPKGEPNAPLLAVGGGVCDVYQPAEKKFKITRKILKILFDYGFPIDILTKSNLVLRDMDLIKKFLDISYVNIAFSITLMDEELQKLFEPNASTTSERFEALIKFKELGCLTGVMAMPLLPGIGANKKNIESIISKANDIDVDYIIFSGLTLKPGNKKFFYKFIDKHFPHLSELYHKMYDDANNFGTPIMPDDYKETNFLKIAHELCKKYNISDRAPRYIPPGSSIKTNLKVSEILYNLQYLKQWVNGEKWYKVKKYTDAAKKIENHPIDIKNYSSEDLQKKLDLKKNTSDLIYKIINENISHYTNLED
ncbi:MAG: hypothetical protein GF329_01125 [Candidatus Lokiarchaeota archaeon]|nr:hypothetical protein [Candidatus Lokiarchaeota archaeon]